MGIPRDIVAKVWKFGLEAGEFEPQSCYYAHFQANIVRKGMNL